MKHRTRVVIEALTAQKDPTTARELARVLADEYDTELTKSEVNSVLYCKEARGLVSKVDQTRWIALQAPKSRPRQKRPSPLLENGAERRAIYIDFEGTETDPPTLLGVLTPDDEFRQYVFEEDVYPAALARGHGKRAGYYCVLADAGDLLSWLVELVEERDFLLVAWSRRELDAIRDYAISPQVKAIAERRYCDAKALAKSWHQRIRPDLEWKKHPERGKYYLDMMARIHGYPIPRPLGPGNTAKRIRDVREQLRRKGGDFTRLTPVAKAKWTKMLHHNYHDCFGMRHVVRSCLADLM